MAEAGGTEYRFVTRPWELSESFDFAGRSVRYAVVGEGPPLVLIHGTPFSSVVWRRIAPHLARRRKVFYFDLLGYGQSDMQADHDVSLGIQNRLLSALLDHWGADRPDIVAHDFGGATALRALLLNNRRYRTLSLIDPVALAPWGSLFVRHVRRHEDAFAQLPAYIHAAIIAAYIGGAAYRPLSDETMKLYVEPWRSAAGQAAFYRQIAQMDQCYTDEIEGRYGEINCPTQILWGEEDAWIPIERGRELASRIPGAIFRPVPDAGHLVQDDAPEAIVAALLEFLPEGSASA